MNMTINSNKKATKRNKGANIISFPKSYTVVDIETTGLDPKYDSIIEVSAIRYVDGNIADKYVSLVKPDRVYYADDHDDDYIIVDREKIYYIDKFITDFTGITNKMLHDAPDTSTVMKEFYKFLSNDIILGHNINFDINFLYDNFVEYLDNELNNDFIDTLRISRRLLTDLKHHRLGDIAKHYNIDTEGAHRALRDCEITNSCFLELEKTMIDIYGSYEDFINSMKRVSRGIRANDIQSSNSEFDVSNPIYDKVFVFTGILEKMSRKEAMQIVADYGGVNKDSVTLNTNYLVLGNNDYCTTIKDGKSSKHKKAESLKLKGKDIDIITENVFYDMIED